MKIDPNDLIKKWVLYNIMYIYNVGQNIDCLQTKGGEIIIWATDINQCDAFNGSWQVRRVTYW